MFTTLRANAFAKLPAAPASTIFTISEAREITEVSSAGAWNRGEVYAGGRHLATYKNGTTNLIHADWLGTERVRTTAAGASCETIASLPFGDGQSTSGSCGDPSPMHFTSKERDSESGLDNFEKRYYGGNVGRLMSPDPVYFQAEMLTDPQRFNEYSYVRNNPLLYIDPSGEAIRLSGDADEQKEQLNAICSAAGIGSDKCSYYIYANQASDGKIGVEVAFDLVVQFDADDFAVL